MRAILLLLSSFLLATSISAQQVENEEKQSNWKDKLVLDGNLALRFGASTLIGGNPQIGYRITDKIIAGAGYSYFLSSTKIGSVKYNDKLHGPTAFTRLLVTDNLFARADYQSLMYVLDSASDAPPQTFNRDRLFLGGGYRYPLSSRVNFTGGLFLDVLDPSARPVFRAGVEAGFGRW